MMRPKAYVQVAALTCGLLCCAARTDAALLVVVPNVTLKANTDNQPILLSVSGGDAVAGVNLRAVLGNGSAAGVEPVFRSFDFATTTIFGTHPGTPTGGPNATFPQDAQANYALNSAGDQVPASGTFVTAYVSTVGLTSGTYAFSLTGTEIGSPTTFVANGGGTITPTITNGSITVPEPGSIFLAALALGILGSRRCRRPLRRSDRNGGN